MQLQPCSMHHGVLRSAVGVRSLPLACTEGGGWCPLEGGVEGGRGPQKEAQLAEVERQKRVHLRAGCPLMLHLCWAHTPRPGRAPGPNVG